MDTWQCVLKPVRQQHNNHVQLPSFDSLFKTLQHPIAPQPTDMAERDVIWTVPSPYQQPHGSCAIAQEVAIPILESPTSSQTHLSAESTPECPPLSIDDLDRFSSDPRERALAAKAIVIYHFGHFCWRDLKQIKANVDGDRPLYGTNAQHSSRGPKSTKKHSMKERGRRDDHSEMFREQDRRMPIQIMELAGYQIGCRKPPGKNHLHVAGLLMWEFDDLLQVKMAEEIHHLDAAIHVEHDASFCPSPRKRKRQDRDFSSMGRMPQPPSSTSSRSSRGYLSPRSGTPSSSSVTW